MAKTTTLPITQTITGSVLSIVNADAIISSNGGTSPSNTKLLLTAGAEGSVVKQITIASDDSPARYVSFYISLDSGTTKYLLTTIYVPSGAGLTGGTTVNVDVLGSEYLAGLPLDQSGKPVILLPASARIYAGITITSVTEGRTIHIIASQEDF